MLHERRPELVYASISGFGQGRPALAGYDQIAQGTSGLMSITGEPKGPPTKVGVPVGDLVAGMFTAHAILAALLERSRTGVGRYVDVALNDGLLAMLTYQAGRYFATGESPGRDGNHHATVAPYGTFATRDGHLNLAIGSDEQYRRFCEALQAPELVADPRFATNAQRQGARASLVVEIERRLTRRTTGEWLARMEAAGIPAGPILDLASVRRPGGRRARHAGGGRPPGGGADQPGGRAVEAGRLLGADSHGPAPARPAHVRGADRGAGLLLRAGGRSAAGLIGGGIRPPMGLTATAEIDRTRSAANGTGA